jgi:DNA-binding NarL/FixJ family response regulator
MRLPIRIVVADDHALFRQGLQALLKHEPEVTIVAETGRADQVMALLGETPCDLLLLDLQMERNSLPDIETLALQIPIVVLTASELSADALTAIRKGARAVVFKRYAVETLMTAIRSVAEGNVWMPPSLQAQLAAQLRHPVKNPLSLREEEVVRYVAVGLRNAEVAKKLSVSEQTIKTHLNTIFKKLGIRDRVELSLYAARAGIIGIGHTR